MIPFVKTQALGNDFILVEQGRVHHDHYRDLSERICDRHLGIGADGLIVWNEGDDGFDLRIFNMDGSEAECSGNGLRCLAAYLTQSDRAGDVVRLRTVAGSYLLRAVNDRFEAKMGRPRLSPPEIPFIAPTPLDRVVDYPLEIGADNLVRITACSTGNPPLLGVCGFDRSRHPADTGAETGTSPRLSQQDQRRIRSHSGQVGNRSGVLGTRRGRNLRIGYGFVRRDRRVHSQWKNRT